MSDWRGEDTSTRAGANLSEQVTSLNQESPSMRERGVSIGCDGIGFEINPYAVLACQVKMKASQLGAEKIHWETQRLKRFYDEATRGSYSATGL